ncbi:MAG: NADP(H)-dependent aldo-keto reductase [Haliscomenobacter sp.]|uniref:NADP(H)-dependent aldo-keto reductase n=1 Tax=Haliscomenobacter sp. TaxID=2717303 RepID=UPI0029B80528|nr:NADP(H)-dependent aldo-keto reductase [Haliscomenobacter sp.]MDX2071763.1 NADP(H)-dependent aldo-keto reductase [Haliscomenobacter sp.]
MQYRQLGKTELQVSTICLGTMTFGEQNTEAEGHAQMDYALEQGINFFDTAEMYSVPSRKETQGSTERIIGTWFKKTGNRDKIILASKVTGPFGLYQLDRGPFDFSKEQINAALEGSLQRLQTDYIDLYQLHWPERKMNMFGKRGFAYDPNDPWVDNFKEVLHALDELVKAGKIRHVGLSNEVPWGLMRFLQESERHNLTRVVSIQNPYNLLNRLFEVGLAEMAIREKVGLLAYSPLGFGRLSGKFNRPGEDLSKARINLFKQYTRYNSPQCLEAVEKYLQIAEKYGLNPTHLALSFVNSRPFLTSNIIGATTMEQLKENIDSIEVNLSEEVLREIDAVHAAIPDPAP